MITHTQYNHKAKENKQTMKQRGERNKHRTIHQKNTGAHTNTYTHTLPPPKENIKSKEQDTNTTQPNKAENKVHTKRITEVEQAQTALITPEHEQQYSHKHKHTTQHRHNYTTKQTA